jgi:hypothetical protein
VNSLAILTDTGGYLIAGTDNGVFQRQSGASTMSLLATGLPAVPVFNLVVDESNGKLFAGTHGRGVWAVDFANKPYLNPHYFWCEVCNFFGVGPINALLVESRGVPTAVSMRGLRNVGEPGAPVASRRPLDLEHASGVTGVRS